MGEAGESARLEAERARRQLEETLARADRLRKRIDSFEAGEEGERITAKALAALPADFVVHHDLHIDGSDANVDHVVVGPTGVYVIDSKHWAGRVSTGKGTLWSGRHQQGRALATLAWETACVAGALASVGAGVPVAVISVTGSGRGARALEINRTWVLPVEMLTDFLTAGPSRLPAGVTRAASEALAAHLLPRAPYPSDARLQPARSPTGHAAESRDPLSVPLSSSGAVRAEIRPRATGPRASGAGPRRAPVAPRRSSASAHTSSRPSLPSSSPRERPRSPERTKRTAQLLVGLLLLGIVGTALWHLGRAGDVTGAATSPLTSPLTTAAAPAPGPPPGGASPAARPLSVAWSCPDPSAGWTATFILPVSEQAALGTWELQVATSEHGPWATEAAGEGEMRMTGMQPHRTGWIRGGNISSIEISGKPIIEGRLTTPVGC